MLVIPLEDVLSQSLNVLLAGQPCALTVYVKTTGTFIDLAVNNVSLLTGVICQDANKIVRDLYFGFIGDLAFFDTMGALDPTSPGLGSRWLLFYLEAADLPAGVG